MKKLFSLWVIRLLGALILGLVIWFAGPLLAFADYHPLEPEWARLALIALLLGFWLVRALLRRMRAGAGNRKLFDLLTRQADNKGKVTHASTPQVRERFEKAAALLKSTQFGQAGGKRSWLGFLGGRQYAYQLPWYVFIGAPGSGKTTALTHSGLQFPLAEQIGTDPLQGIGGTRNCEWWFTDQAVLIDTAGRYTTQDSNTASDAAEWSEFVDLIKRFRPRQPINGVLATISASDLLDGHAAAAELQKQATAIRARINELQRQLGHAFPVYLLVTKSDLLPGFTQFFEDLTREQREQVWGCTFDFKDGKSTDGVTQLRPQLDALESRLFEQLLPRLQSSRDGSARALTYNFPNQWVQLKEAVAEFASQAFASSRLAGPVWLRGIYFTSGTQEGTPIDRVLGSLARSFGIERKMLPPQKPSGKSFFITRLLRDVVFVEAGLAGINLDEERRLRRMKWAGIAAGIVAVSAAIGLWSTSYVGNKLYIDDVQARTGTFKKALSEQPPESGDLPRLIAVLDASRGLSRTVDVDPTAPPMLMRAGLFQGEKLQAGAEQVYGRLLSAYLAPYLSQRIENGLHKQASNPELQYETLKAYLMLHRHGKLDLAALKAWIAFDLESEKTHLPPDLLQQVMLHVDALLDRDSVGPATTADANLVAAVRKAQLQAPFAQRVYNRIQRQGTDGKLKEFRLTDAGGPNSQLVFARRSGQPLDSGVPSVFTYNGYYKSFNPQLDSMLRQMAEEEVWVLGVADSGNARRAANATSRDALADEVRQLYLRDYATVWERYIGDIALARTANLAQSIEQARILSGPDSPLPRLLRGLAREVTLSERPASKQRPAAKVNEMINQGKDKLDALLGTKEEETESADRRRVESIVDDRFEALRRFVRNPAPNQPAPVDASLALINELYTLFSATEAALKAGNALPVSDVPNKVRAEAARMPEPVRSMLGGLADNSQRQAVSTSRANISSQLAGSVSAACQKALSGRYPFAPNSRKDVVPEDFVRILAPAGVMDEFFQKNLAPLVDTSTRPWRFRNLGDASTGGASDALIQFERAQEIRRVFFPPGSNGLSFRLNLRPVDMDNSITQSILDVDGQLISYAHGNVPPVSVQWPGPRATNQITLQITLARGGEEVQTFEGPWALFRLFDRAQIARSGQPERFRATFRIAGRRVSYDVTTSSVQNPFRLPELQAFQCPAKL